MNKNNSIDITDLQKADLTVGDLKDLVAVLECCSAHLVLPTAVEASLRRLVEKVERKG
jgi:hypothetical protein